MDNYRVTYKITEAHKIFFDSKHHRDQGIVKTFKKFIQSIIKRFEKD